MTPLETVTLHAQLACVWEACAHKAGNITRRDDFTDTTLVDFLASAAAAAPALASAGEIGVGPAVLEAVRRTRLVTRPNTNLGIALLLAPLCAARSRPLADVLASLTVADSRAVGEAIRLCRPGGLGAVNGHDVADEPTLPLGEWMALATARDRIARQYATGFADVLGTVAGDLNEGLQRGEGLEMAIRWGQLWQLREHADSLIARKRGPEEAEEVRRRAAAVLDAGWPDTPEGRVAWNGLDEWLREGGNARNPGTTADLLAAGLFVLQGDGRLPVDARW
jgi:triphosphoribosyl-dephospho-CoA synthase